MAGLGTELTDGPPQDGVTSLRFAGHADQLLVSSWDCTVRLFDATLGTCTTTLKHTMPVLDTAWVVRHPRLGCPVAAPAAMRCGGAGD
jgi:WD40 repeat protein